MGMPALAIRPFEDGELRVLDLDLAERLGFERPRDVRKLIERNLEELERYGRCATVAQRPEGGGPEATEYWLNEHQAVLICVLSKTLRAADVRQEVIEVFMAFRHGRIVPAAPTLEQIGSLFEEKLEPVHERMNRIEGNVVFLGNRIDAMAPRHDFTKETRSLWRMVIHALYQDFCPCCRKVKILDDHGEKIPDGLHYDHFRGRERNGVDEGWPVCPKCNLQLKNDAAFKEDRRAHFKVFHDLRKQMFAERSSRSPRGRGGIEPPLPGF